MIAVIYRRIDCVYRLFVEGARIDIKIDYLNGDIDMRFIYDKLVMVIKNLKIDKECWNKEKIFRKGDEAVQIKICKRYFGSVFSILI